MLLLDRTLLRLSKGSWGWIIAIVVVRTLNLVAVTKFAYVIGGFLPQLLEPNMNLENAKVAIFNALLASVFMFLTQLIQGELEFRCSAQARKKIRSTIFKKVMNLDLRDVEKIGPVSTITSSVDAVEQVQVYYSTYLPSLIFSFIAPIYLFFRLYSMSFFTACILVGISFILLPIHNVFRYKIENLRKTYWNSVEDMTAYFLDSLRGLVTLKLFEQDKKHKVVLEEKAEKLNTDINAFMKINFTSFLVTEGLMYAAIILALVINCMDMRKGSLTLGNTLTIFLLSYSFFSSVKQLMSATHSALTAVSAALKIEELLGINTERTYDPSAKKDNKNYDGIRLDHVSFSYDDRVQTLKDVSIDIKRGSVVALAGLSGCGKSTIASMIMRFIDPSQGNVYIEGDNYYSLKPSEIHKKVILVPQTVSIFHGTIKDNLLFAKEDASDEELLEVLDRVKLRKFVDSLPDGLNTDVGDSGSRLSGGQRQKIGIARALLSQAPYIIFDESTSAVDRESEIEIWKCIEELSDTRTLIIISHRLSTIKNCDVIYVLEQGKLVQRGTHTQLLQEDGLYRTLVQQQNQLEGIE